MKMYNEPICVETCGRYIRCIQWSGRVFAVQEIIEDWKTMRQWWSAPDERHYFLLSTDGGILEIYRSGGQWILSRMMD